MSCLPSVFWSVAGSQSFLVSHDLVDLEELKPVELPQSGLSNVFSHD